MDAIGKPLDGEYELVNESTEDYWPPTFVLQSVITRRSAVGDRGLLAAR